MGNEIRRAMDTGKVILGKDKTLRNLKLGHAKLIIAASNCPPEILADAKCYAGLIGVPIHIFEGNGRELGFACGKTFSVNVLAVLDPGTSNLMSVRETK